MRLTISSDYRYQRTPDGQVWTDGPCHYQHFTRYLAAFNEVNVIARVQDVANVSSTMVVSTGPQVAFSPVPFYHGALQYALKSRQIAREAAKAIGKRDAILLSAPAALAGVVRARLEPNRPFGLQVLGDPYEVFAPGVIQHPLRPALRWWSTHQLQRLARQASAVLYVTERALQRRYPAGGTAFAVSDVDLSDEAFRKPSNDEELTERPFTLIGVGTMSQLYKGFDVLLAALAKLRDRQLNLKLVLIGDGKYRPLLMEKTQQLRLPNVEFRGQLPAGAAIRQELDQADLFVMPSRTEGMPRALVEAMARSLPCIASRVGGIPEVLPEDALVPACDADELAAAIARALSDSGWRRQMAIRNYERARDFRAERLERLRQAFYQHVADLTQDWLDARGVVRDSALAKEATP